MAKVEDIGIASDEFKNKIRHFREKILGLTIEEMAELVDVSATCIHKWESGKSVPNHARIIKRLVEIKMVGGGLK